MTNLCLLFEVIHFGTLLISRHRTLEDLSKIVLYISVSWHFKQTLFIVYMSTNNYWQKQTLLVSDGWNSQIKTSVYKDGHQATLPPKKYRLFIISTFFVWKYRILTKISVIGDNFLFNALIWKLKLKRIDCIGLGSSDREKSL